MPGPTVTTGQQFQALLGRAQTNVAAAGAPTQSVIEAIGAAKVLIDHNAIIGAQAINRFGDQPQAIPVQRTKAYALVDGEAVTILGDTVAVYVNGAPAEMIALTPGAVGVVIDPKKLSGPLDVCYEVTPSGERAVGFRRSGALGAADAFIEDKNTTFQVPAGQTLRAVGQDIELDPGTVMNVRTPALEIDFAVPAPGQLLASPAATALSGALQMIAEANPLELTTMEIDPSVRFAYSALTHSLYSYGLAHHDDGIDSLNFSGTAQANPFGPVILPQPAQMSAEASDGSPVALTQTAGAIAEPLTTLRIVLITPAQREFLETTQIRLKQSVTPIDLPKPEVDLATLAEGLERFLEADFFPKKNDFPGFHTFGPSTADNAPFGNFIKAGQSPFAATPGLFDNPFGGVNLLEYKSAMPPRVGLDVDVDIYALDGFFVKPNITNTPTIFNQFLQALAAGAGQLNIVLPEKYNPWSPSFLVKQPAAAADTDTQGGGSHGGQTFGDGDTESSKPETESDVQE